MKYRLLVLACSQRKKGDPEWLDAIERYDGPLWQTLRSIELPPNLAVMALSARYGLFRSWLPIETYDDRMTPTLVKAAVSGNTRNPLTPDTYRPFWHASVNELRDAREAIRFRQATRFADLFSDVCMVGGESYLKVMRCEIRRHQHPNGRQCIETKARVTEINGPIGLMRKELREWLLDADRSKTTSHETATPTQQTLFAALETQP